ncbi:MAG: signal peptide peptidase SppA [Sphingobacteriaceae bacterium]|nr:signal peptide peptidase SppA [Sphingobacteriaceae bacterium]
MKDFFKYVLATMVGIVLSSIVMVLVSIIFIVSLVAIFSDDKETQVSENSVLHLNLDQSITERTPENSLKGLPFMDDEESKSIGFLDVIKSLQKAKTDPNIKCVYLTVSNPNAGFATLREVRNALLDFKKSHKKIIAYSEVYTQSAYYLASTADKVYLNPEGMLEFKGFNSQIIFFKGALDKLGIEAQVIRVGNFKSAVEPFVNTKMSEANKKQVSVYLQGLYKVFLNDISETRNINYQTLFAIANNLKIQQPKDALHAKMIDGLRYKDEILDELRRLSNTPSKEKINTTSINEYANTLNNHSSEKDKIAIIYANGSISGGEGSDEEIGSERISRAIRKAREDKNIKAIVLRVNSPGGSALASDVIWREIVLAKKNKPVIASFGDVAASGGYYIACAADSIIVQPNTITGSIGVFGIIPNFQNLLNNKLGITFDGVKTGMYADIMSLNRPMTAGERMIIQNGVNRIYDGFISRVADGRKKSKKYIDGIGGGRVWVGTDAVKIGLADKLGSFNDAILSAAKKANLKNYKVVEYPEKIDFLKSLLEETTNKVSVYYAQKELGDNYLLYKKIKEASKFSGIQAKMEYDLNIN